MTISGYAPSFRFIAHSVGGSPSNFSASISDARNLPLLPDEAPFSYVLFHRGDRPYNYFYEGPANTFAFTTGSDVQAARDIPLMSVTGHVESFLLGAQLAVHKHGEQIWEYNAHVSDSSLTSTPFGIDVARKMSYSFATMEITDIRFAPNLGMGLHGEMYLQHPDGAVNGSIQAPGATGQVVVGGEDLRTDGDPVVLAGQFGFQLRVDPQGQTLSQRVFGMERETFLRAEGTFEEVWVGGRLQHQAGPNGGAVASAAAAGSVLLVLARVFRASLFSMLGALSTRINPGDALDHPSRRTILEVVKREPGIHKRELERRTGYAWGKLHYHLKILQDAGSVRCQKVGKHALVFPADRKPSSSGDGLHLRGRAADVYALLPLAGGATQADLSDRLGISRQLVGHHLRRMASEGLVRVVSGRPKRYRRVKGPVAASHQPERPETRDDTDPSRA